MSDAGIPTAAGIPGPGKTVPGRGLNLTRPDRVPVMPLNILYYANRALGLTNKEGQYDYVKRFDCIRQIVTTLDLDFAPQVVNLTPTPFFEIMGVKDFKWPGGELGDNAPNQYIEGEYLLEEEYDEFLADPNTVTYKKLWPRISTTMGHLANIQIPPIHGFTTGWFLGVNVGVIACQPDAMTFCRKMIDLGEETLRYLEAVTNYFMGMAALGYPVSWPAGTFPAFDIVSHDLRGLKGTVLDMYRRPEKLLALIDMMTPASIQMALTYAQMYNATRVLVPILRGVDGVLSDEQFAKFYWPSLKTLLQAMLDNNLTPMVWFEADCTSRLKYFREFPPGQHGGPLPPCGPEKDQGTHRRSHVLLGERAVVPADRGHPAAGQGRRQGTHRHLRRQRRPDHRRRHRHSGRGQTGERGRHGGSCP